MNKFKEILIISILLLIFISCSFSYILLFPAVHSISTMGASVVARQFGFDLLGWVFEKFTTVIARVSDKGIEHELDHNFDINQFKNLCPGSPVFNESARLKL